MANIILGCDNNNSNDHKVQNTVANILEKAGHKVTKLKVDSNAFASASYSKSNKGKVGVYLMAASVFSVADFAYGSTQMKYAYFGIRGDASPSIKTENDFNSKKIKPDNDCTSICNKLAGMTYPDMNKKTKNRCQCVFGKTGEEIGNAIVQAMGGGTSNSSSNSDSASSIKEAIKDVMYHWDGEAELFIRDDTVHIRKIPSPSTATLSLIEGQNIDMDSVNVIDYNPSAVNYLTCSFDDYLLTIQDEYLVKRFGKISSNVKPGKNIKTLKQAKSFLQREWNKLKRDNGHKLELRTYGHSKWRDGEWCRVYLPSFNINDYMYITKVSQDEDSPGDWTCNLELVDWPPGFGEPAKTEDDSNKSSDSK